MIAYWAIWSGHCTVKLKLINSEIFIFVVNCPYTASNHFRSWHGNFWKHFRCILLLVLISALLALLKFHWEDFTWIRFSLNLHYLWSMWLIHIVSELRQGLLERQQGNNLRSVHLFSRWPLNVFHHNWGAISKQFIVGKCWISALLLRYNIFRFMAPLQGYT